MRDIPKIVITGGPCAGKTTGLAFLREKLSDFGFYPIFVPESATLLIGSGVSLGRELLSNEAFQRRVLGTALGLEKEIGLAALEITHPKPVIICDRGIIDAQAYMSSPEEFEKLLECHGLSFAEASSGRYKGVFHLRTAALGAEEFYTLENNTARRETPEEARCLDEATLAAWIGHPHLRVIPNEGSFEKKMKRLLAESCSLLGIPEPVEIERKYLVNPDFSLKPLGAYQEVEIEQFYLDSKVTGEQLRFRKRVQRGEAVCFKTRKRQGPDPVSRVETESFITEKEYEVGKQYQIPDSRIIRKRRICFVYDHQYFELDEFLNPELEYCLLEIELTNSEDEIRLPPFLPVVGEVTGDKRYSNSALALV